MVCLWYAHGMWHVHGIFMVCSWYVHDVFVVCVILMVWSCMFMIHVADSMLLFPCRKVVWTRCWFNAGLT